MNYIDIVLMMNSCSYSFNNNVTNAEIFQTDIGNISDNVNKKKFPGLFDIFSHSNFSQKKKELNSTKEIKF